MHLIGQAVKKIFLRHFPNPSKLKRGQERDPYGVVKAWFAAGNTVDLLTDLSAKKFTDELGQVAGLKKIAENAGNDPADLPVLMELALHGLAEFEVLNKEFIQTKWVFKDFLTGNLKDEDEGDLRDLFN
jgi:magnesium chelatase subunit I